ncbi:MAG TPA: hypothetical protein VIK52_07295 [Opitutaceae bacterium]
MRKKKSKKRSHLIGLGLDNSDGHKRITSGEDFSIVGGSQETHEKMTETVLKTFETLDRRGKTLHEVEPTELGEILRESTPE